jgi:hypothetical protein
LSQQRKPDYHIGFGLWLGYLGRELKELGLLL